MTANDNNKSDSSVSMIMQNGGTSAEEFTSDEEMEECIVIQNNLSEKQVYRTNREKVEIEILHFCEQIQAPIYGYDMLVTIL